jgi:hypothetical protein
MTTCIVIHNMIIKDETGMTTNRNFDNLGLLADTSNHNTHEHDTLTM